MVVIGDLNGMPTAIGGVKMAFDPASAAVSLGGDLVKGVLGFFGGKNQNEAQERIAAQNIALQKEFAQNGVQWKVADARAAGISPLAALGANTTSFAPVTVGSVNEMSPLADMAGNMGQDLSRAVHASRSQTDRELAVAKTADDLKLKNMDLQNQLLSAQIAKISAPAVGPGFPAGGAVPLDKYLMMPGQGDSKPAVVPLPESPIAKEQINAGGPWMSNPSFSGAQQIQNQYGDIAEDIYGMAVKLPADTYYNWIHNFSPRLARHLWKYRYDLNPFNVSPAY